MRLAAMMGLMQATETVATISSAAGELRVSRARIADYETAMRILREAADWLNSRGNPQGEHADLTAGSPAPHSEDPSTRAARNGTRFGASGVARRAA